jgi:iron complex outermembrane receptor protein
LAEVTVTEQRLQALGNLTPATALHFRGDSLSLSQQSSLARGLAELPGLSMRNTGIGVAKPVVRGHSGTRVAVVHNGILQEDQQWSMDHGLSMDAGLAEQVTVLRGASSLLYGSGAFGGTVFTERQPPHTEGAPLFRSESFYHSVNALWGQRLAYAQGGDRQGISASLHHQRYGDFHIPAASFNYNGFVLPVEDQRLDNTAGRVWSGAVACRRRWSATQLSFEASRYFQESGFFPGAVGRPGFFNLGADAHARDIDIPHQNQTHDRLQAHLSHLHDDGRVSHLRLGYQRNRREEYSDPEAHGQPREAVGTLANGLELHTWSLHALRKRALASGLELRYGLQGQWRRNTQEGFEFFIPGFSSVRLASFGVAQWQMNDKHRFEGGLRLGYAAYRLRADSVANFRGGELEGYQRRSQAARPNFLAPALQLGWRWHPAENWRVYARLARGYRFPNIAEVAANGVDHGTFAHVVGDPGLETEVSWQLEAATRWRSGPWKIQLTPYANYFPRYLFLDPTPVLSSLPGGGQQLRYRQNQVLQGGGELSLRYRPPWWSVQASGAATWLQNLDTELPIPFVPPPDWQTTVALHPPEQAPMEGWRLAVTHRLVAGQSRVSRAEFGRETPSYQRWDLSLRYRLQWANGLLLRASAEVENLLNTEYQKHLSRYRLVNLPEPGRNVRLGLRLAWR